MWRCGIVGRAIGDAVLEEAPGDGLVLILEVVLVVKEVDGVFLPRARGSDAVPRPAGGVVVDLLQRVRDIHVRGHRGPVPVHRLEPPLRRRFALGNLPVADQVEPVGHVHVLDEVFSRLHRPRHARHIVQSPRPVHHPGAQLQLDPVVGDRHKLPHFLDRGVDDLRGPAVCDFPHG